MTPTPNENDTVREAIAADLKLPWSRPHEATEVPGSTNNTASASRVSPHLQHGPACDAAIEADKRSGWSTSLLSSIVLHGALIGWLVWQPHVDAIGGGGQELDTVSVEVISSSALESIAMMPSAGIAVAAAPVADTAGTDAPPQIETAAATPSAAPDKRTPREPQASDIAAPPDDVQEALLTANEKPLDVRPKEPPELDKPEPVVEPKQIIEKQEPEPQPTPSTTASDAQAGSTQGGAMSSADGATMASEAAAGAAAGELARYAVEVRLAIGRHRPRHAGARGRVVVAFALSPVGGVESVSILRSSGNSGADDAALAAIRATTFPAPPAHSTDKQRSYTVPFEFR